MANISEYEMLLINLTIYLSHSDEQRRNRFAIRVSCRTSLSRVLWYKENQNGLWTKASAIPRVILTNKPIYVIGSSLISKYATVPCQIDLELQVFYTALLLQHSILGRRNLNDDTLPPKWSKIEEIIHAYMRSNIDSPKYKRTKTYKDDDDDDDWCFTPTFVHMVG